MTSPRLTASIVIPTRNRPEALDRCLAAVMLQDYPRFDVLVVDSGPSDERARLVAERWGVRYARDPVRGLSRARNLGASLSSTDVVAYVDDDAAPEPGWLGALMEEFADPQVMAVAGVVLPLCVETEVQRAGAAALEADLRVTERRVVDLPTPAWFELACFGGIGNGGGMAFRRQAWSIWPGFDERLGRGARLPGCEEHYAFFRLIASGYRAVSTPKAIVRHPLPSTMDEIRECAIRDASSASAYLTLLLFEASGYRLRVLRYVLEALAGKRRKWRGEAKVAVPRVLPYWRALQGYLKGPFLYAQACWTRPSPRSRSCSFVDRLALIPEVSLDPAPGDYRAK